MGFPQAFIRSLGAGRPVAGVPPSSGYPPSAGAMSTPPKIKYREQSVDELLQLKLHQALAALDGPPPPNDTIVLTTSDRNIGQLNEDGFLGPVRTALKKGWRVELYACQGGGAESGVDAIGVKGSNLLWTLTSGMPSTPIVLQNANGDPNQVWTFTPVK
ncbi:hypothetical protein B0H11DRAFT_2321543 [Mycena galericulata]|nr:hypothetical protein B0H11DRAFT_2321543 [Mycena galericulata]